MEICYTTEQSTRCESSSCPYNLPAKEQNCCHEIVSLETAKPYTYKGSDNISAVPPAMDA